MPQPNVTWNRLSHILSPIWTGNGLDHMNYLHLGITDGASGLEPGDEIGIFDGSRCVGSGVIRNAGEAMQSFVVLGRRPDYR